MTANLQSASSVSLPVHRFTFTTEFNNELLSFSKIHQHDDRHTYKDAWKRWIENNAVLIVSESHSLKNNGFHGDIMEKMFKSGRYYFRNKTHTSQSTSTSRRKYISLDIDVISAMDLHIEKYCTGTSTGTNTGTNTEKDISNKDITTIIKPSTGFILFITEHSNILIEDTKRLTEHLSSREINEKYKKTYKNRFYLHTKRLQNINTTL